ncbi:MAG TPA: hypothetical protein VFL76_09675 [Edaphocola sp.]|nr:hypothetical protein [Edaphocola sp.]
MKKIILSLLMVCFLATTLHAQVIYNSSGKKGEAQYKQNAQKEGFDPHKLIFGGGFGFGFGSGSLTLSISPVAGYRFTDRFSAGLRLGYQYNWIKDGQYVINGMSGMVEAKNFNYHIIGPGVWTRFIVWNNIFLHAAYEYNIFTYKSYNTTYTMPGTSSYRAWDHANSLLLGIGLRQPVSDNASFVLMVGYDVLQNISSNMRTDVYGQKYSISPYAGTLDVRIGFNIGF